MYQEFYGFTRLPFERDIAPDHLFVSQPQQEMAARLTFLLRQRGLGLVTGDIGAGKSTSRPVSTRIAFWFSICLIPPSAWPVSTATS